MIKIISDGSCEFSNDEASQYNVSVVPFYIIMNGKDLKEGVDIQKKEYFDLLASDKSLYPTTSQPTPQDFVEAYQPALENNDDLIIFTISSKLSGSNQSANIAADMMREDYPNAKITVIDTLNGSVGHYLIMKEVLRAIENGYTYEQAVDIANKLVPKTHTYFTLDTLEYLKKGGRVGPTQALVGGILGVKPVLGLDNGEIKSLESVRGKKKVISTMVNAVCEVLKGNENNANIAAGQINRLADAQDFIQGVESKLGITIDNPIIEVGATIGTHAGPGALAVAYTRKYETL